MRRTGALDWLQVCRRTPAPSDLLMALWGPLGPSSRPFLSLDLYALGFSHSYLASLAFYYSRVTVDTESRARARTPTSPSPPLGPYFGLPI